MNAPSETEENLKRRAYVIGLQLKREGQDSEVIYARLEKQGFPVALAKQVATDVNIERQKETKIEKQPQYYTALLKIGIGSMAAIASWIISPDHFLLPLGLIAGGIFAAFFHKRY